MSTDLAVEVTAEAAGELFDAGQLLLSAARDLRLESLGIVERHRAATPKLHQAAESIMAATAALNRVSE